MHLVSRQYIQTSDPEVEPRKIGASASSELDPKAEVSCSDLERFDSIRMHIIRPLMENMSVSLCSRAIKCSILESDKQYDEKGRVVGRSCISIRVILSRSDRDEIENVPCYAVCWDQANSIARLTRKFDARHFPGEVHIDGTASLQELTSDFISSRLLAFARSLI